MNPGTMPVVARLSALPEVAAEPDHSPNAGLYGDIQELCSRSMDRALGIEKVSLDTVVSLNSRVIDLYKDAFQFAPFDNLFDMAARSFAVCTEWQMSWLGLLAPHAGRQAASNRVTANMARSRRSQAHPAAEGLEHSLDLVIGAGAK